MAIEDFVSHSAPFGQAIPEGNPHAVSASLPERHDVQRLFRDRDENAWAQLDTTYPRFGDHPFIRQALELHGAGEGRHAVALSSPEAAQQLVTVMPAGELIDPEIEADGKLTFLSFVPRTEQSIDVLTVSKKVTGGVPSSRRAEDFLISKGVSSFLGRPYYETVDRTANQETVEHDLSKIYYPARPEVFLANSGMSAVSAAVDAIHEVRNQDYDEDEIGRDTWVILGNLYRDTEDLVKRRPGTALRVVRDIPDLEGLETVIDGLGGRVAGVLTEAPTNPLLDVPDLEQVKDLLGDIPLVVDVSSAGSLLVDAFPYADVVVESLTKFASGHGDMMMGAIAVNPDSEYGDEISGLLPDIVEPPYGRDVQRFAYELDGWHDRAARTGKNVMALAEFFEGHDRINGVYWTGSERSRDGYARLARHCFVHAGLITVDVKRSMRPVYDALDLAKGPSFGTQFTLNTDFLGIVYPQEIRDSAGRGMLERRTGLNNRMLRVSVGTEDPDWLIDRYAAALR